MTWQYLLDALIRAGANDYHADNAIGRLMDAIEDETGIWPDWDSIAPDWAISALLRGGN